jgi:hypothetical protein
VRPPPIEAPSVAAVAAEVEEKLGRKRFAATFADGAALDLTEAAALADEVVREAALTVSAAWQRHA